MRTHTRLIITRTACNGSVTFSNTPGGGGAAEKHRETRRVTVVPRAAPRGAGTVQVPQRTRAGGRGGRQATPPCWKVLPARPRPRRPLSLRRRVPAVRPSLPRQCPPLRSSVASVGTGHCSAIPPPPPKQRQVETPRFPSQG